MDARRAAVLLCGQVIGRDKVACPGPGHSAKDRSLVVKLDPRAPDGFLVFSHSGDDWRASRDFVRTRFGLPPWQPGDDWRNRAIEPQHVAKWDFGHVEAEVAEDAERSYTPEELARIANARKIWDSSKPIGNTLAERYLRQYRKLDPFDTAGRVLRFHAKCPWRNEDTGITGFVPALIAAFRTIADGEIVAIHRIALREDGGKIGRRMLGPVRGVAIMLDALDDGGRLAIAEGVETALAARQIGAVTVPIWALGSTSLITRFPIIGVVRELTLIAERDAASTKAIQIAGERWQKAGKTVRVAEPDASYKDFNDQVMAEAVA